MKLRICIAGLLLVFAVGDVEAQRQRQAAPAGNAGRTLTVMTEPDAPNAIVWLDEIRRGVTDNAGKLAQLKVSSGAHTLRVRAARFREITTPGTALPPGAV